MEISRYNRAVMPLTAKALIRMMNAGEINFDNQVQRAAVWNNTRKSKLIVSMIYDMPIGNLMTYKEHGTKIYDCLDGKQRSHAIKEFVAGEFALTQGIMIEGRDFSGKYFYDLPENVREYILDYSLNVIYFDSLTVAQQEMVFLNLNNGQPISNVDRAWCATKAKSQIKELCNSPIFDEMSEKDREKRKDKDLVIKVCAMLKMETPSMDSKDINPFVESLELTNEDSKEVANILNEIYNIHEILKKEDERIARKIYKPTHIISLVPFIREHKDAVDFIEHFFTGSPSINNTYNQACLQGSGHSQNIKVRVDVIQKEWEKWKV